MRFENPRLLLLLIPLLGLSLIPYLRLPGHRRRTRNRIVSLIIHILILSLAVPLLAGISIHTERELDAFDVVIVADVSDSNEEAMEAMNQRIEALLSETYAAEFNIGVVTFGGDQLSVARMTNDPEQVLSEYLDTKKKPDPSATDIASALYYAKSLLSELTNSRLILLSDGLATDGDALLAAKAIADEGVRVYAIHTEHEGHKEEVQLHLAEVAEDVSVGEATTVSVSLQSAAAGAARLVLYDNGTRCVEKTVALSGGIEEFELIYEPLKGGLHELCIKVETESDTWTQNNEVYSYVYLDLSEKILIVDSTGHESATLQELLIKDFDVTVVRPNQVPEAPEELGTYAEIILMNVDAEDLPVGYDEQLHQYVYENGGGLFTVGGKETYALGHMAGTRFDDLLPIRLTDDEEQVLELMLIMDISASMSHIADGSDRPKVEIAKDGAIECVQALKDADYVGIVTFDRNAQVFQPISPATNRNQIIKKIRGIETGVGTYYSNALNIARSVLFNSKNDADKQHVIFLTDGSPSDDGYTEIIRSMVSKGITVSAIAICREGDEMVSRVEEIARVGNGRSYVVSDAGMLPSIMRRETELSQRELINERRVTPKYKDYSPVIQGIDRLPSLDGYIGVAAKPDAKVVYSVGIDPIYAEWSYGAGQVGSFMSDLGGLWSKDFLAAENGRLFMRNVVRNLERVDAGDEDSEVVVGDRIVAEFEHQNRTCTVHVRKKVEVGHAMQATVTAPDGTVVLLPLQVAGESGYQGSFETELPGVYAVLLEETDDSGASVATAEAFTTFSYSKEYDAFSDPFDGYMHLNELCVAGGGRIILPDETVFKKETVVISEDHDLRLPITLAIMVLFLLDIAARKFHFKWIHEMVRKGK